MPVRFLTDFGWVSLPAELFLKAAAWLDKSPDHASVRQAVERRANRLTHRRWSAGHDITDWHVTEDE